MAVAFLIIYGRLLRSRSFRLNKGIKEEAKRSLHSNSRLVRA